MGMTSFWILKVTFNHKYINKHARVHDVSLNIESEIKYKQIYVCMCEYEMVATTCH